MWVEASSHNGKKVPLMMVEGVPRFGREARKVHMERRKIMKKRVKKNTSPPSCAVLCCVSSMPKACIVGVCLK